MGHRYAELAFTDGIKALQERAGSRDTYARMEAGPDSNDLLSEREAAFIALRDGFYMASTSETGWPYVQHRGGPAGFVKILDAKTIAFADFRGNRQYVSAGNLAHDDRVSLFFMDYPNRARLKLMGRVRLSEDPKVINALMDEGYKAKAERAFVITVEAFDWNCPAHITSRYTAEEIERLTAPLRDRIAELEAQLAG